MTVRELCETVNCETKIIINDGKAMTAKEILHKGGELVKREIVGLTYGKNLFIVEAYSEEELNNIHSANSFIFDLSDFEETWNDFEKKYRKKYIDDKKTQGDIDWLAARVAQFGQHLVNCSEAIATEFYDRKDNSFTLTIDSVVNNDNEERNYPYIRFTVS